MPVTVGANSMSVVHASSNGTSPSFPDVCNTPAPPAPPIPIPYPNIAMSSDTAKGSKKVKCDGKPICHKDSNFSTSTGDEAGSVGGVASGKTKGKAEFINYSFDVKVEGSNVARALARRDHLGQDDPGNIVAWAPQTTFWPATRSCSTRTSRPPARAASWSA